MNIDTLYTALGLVTLGVALSLVGRHLRNEYRRRFTDNPRAMEDPAHDLMEAGLRRAAVMFLTGGATLVMIGIAIAGTEAMRYLQHHGTEASSFDG